MKTSLTGRAWSLKRQILNDRVSFTEKYTNLQKPSIQNQPVLLKDNQQTTPGKIGADYTLLEMVFSTTH